MDEYDFMSEVLSEMDRVVRKALSESVRDAVREEIALLGLSMEADAEHEPPSPPRPAEAEPFVLFTGLGTDDEPPKPAPPSKDINLNNPLVYDLQEFRSLAAKNANGRPAYQIFHNQTLNDIVAKMPRDKDELLSVFGVGPHKVKLYGSDILRIVNRHRTSDKNQERVETFSIPDTIPDDATPDTVTSIGVAPFVNEDGEIETEDGVWKDGVFFTWDELDERDAKEDAKKRELATAPAKSKVYAHVNVSGMDDEERWKAVYTGIAFQPPGTVIDARGFMDAYGIYDPFLMDSVIERLDLEGITSWRVDTSLPEGSAEVLVRTDYVHEWE